MLNISGMNQGVKGLTLELSTDFTRLRRPIWITPSSKDNAIQNYGQPATEVFTQNIHIFVVNTVPSDGLAPLGIYMRPWIVPVGFKKSLLPFRCLAITWNNPDNFQL